MYILITLFCLTDSPLVEDCHLVIDDILKRNRSECITSMIDLNMKETLLGYSLVIGQCRKLERTTI